MAHHGQKFALGPLGRLRLQGQFAFVGIGREQFFLDASPPPDFAAGGQVGKDKKSHHQAPAGDEQEVGVAGIDVGERRAGAKQPLLLVDEGFEVGEIAVEQGKAPAARVQLQCLRGVLFPQRDELARIGQERVPIGRDRNEAILLLRIVVREGDETLQVPGGQGQCRPVKIESGIGARNEKRAHAALGVGDVVPQLLRGRQYLQAMTLPFFGMIGSKEVGQGGQGDHQDQRQRESERHVMP